jgi:hypothetical protein
MSFLESIQHGLEKASQQAARITKIQHLHNVAHDLNFKASQQGQTLVARAMEMYHNGILAQGELTAICKQIADFQQQLHEIQEELQRLQSDGDEQQEIAEPPPLAPGYQGYPQATPDQTSATGALAPGYPAYPTGYPAPQPVAPGYPAPAGYPPYPPQGDYPTSAGIPVQQPASAPPVPSSKQPTQPLTLSGGPPPAPEEPVPQSAPPAHPHRATHHRSASAASPEPAATTDQQSAPPAGTYANGTLPPIYSPFAQSQAASAPPEPEHPAKTHHSSKKAASDTAAQET